MTKQSHRFISTHNRSLLDNYTDVVCYYLIESKLSYVGENKQKNKEKVKCDSDFCSATNLRLWHLMCSVPFFKESKVTSRVSPLKREREREREIERSSVLAVEVLKAPYKRCVVSF